jgi:hypothetical protein
MREYGMGRFLCLIFCLCGCIAAAQTSQAAGRVQGFELGDLGVTTIGDAGIKGTFQGVTPPEGSAQLLLTTVGMMHNEDMVPSQSGSFAVSNLNLQNFFQLTLVGGQEGSGVLIPFTVSAGDGLLTVQCDFLSNENFQGVPHDDFAFSALYDSNGPLQVSTFASVFSSSFSVFDANNSDPFQFHTGYQTLSFDVSGFAPGNYSLGLGVDDRGSPDHASGLLIDNVQLVAAVPEPSTIGLAIGGAILFLALRYRIKRA